MYVIYCIVGCVLVCSGHKESLSSCFLDPLQNKWAESTTALKRKRRKVHIPAGKSITEKDVLGELTRRAPIINFKRVFSKEQI
jgi:hypothetical protein